MLFHDSKRNEPQMLTLNEAAIAEAESVKYI